MSWTKFKGIARLPPCTNQEHYISYSGTETTRGKPGVYVQRVTTALEVPDCRDLKRACGLARDLGRPLNTLVTFAPYPGSLPSPEARAVDLNRLRTYLRKWAHDHLGKPLFAVHVWHSDVTGRNPHVHVFMHCPPRLRDELREALDGVYPEPRVIDVCYGSDTRKMHQPSGWWGSTLDYLMRFQSQQAWWGGGRKTYRASVRDENGRRRGIKAPILGKRWGCTRNLNHRAVQAYWLERAERRKAA